MENINDLLKEYKAKKFNDSQLAKIREGLLKGLDVSWYAKKGMSWRKMGIILDGLEEGLDVSHYALIKYNIDQMQEIKWGLESGVDVSIYAKPDFKYYKNFSLKAPFFRYGDEKLIENQQLRTKKK